MLLLHDCVVNIGSIGLVLLGTIRLFQSFCNRKVISTVHHSLIANLQRRLQKNPARLKSCLRQFGFRLNSNFLSCQIGKKLMVFPIESPYCFFFFYLICLSAILCQSFSATPEVSKDWGSLVEEEEEREANLQKKEMTNPR